MLKNVPKLSVSDAVTEFFRIQKFNHVLHIWILNPVGKVTNLLSFFNFAKNGLTKES